MRLKSLSFALLALGAAGCVKVVPVEIFSYQGQDYQIYQEIIEGAAETEDERSKYYVSYRGEKILCDGTVVDCRDKFARAKAGIDQGQNMSGSDGGGSGGSGGGGGGGGGGSDAPA